MQAAKQVEPNGNQSLESGTCHLFSISHHSAEEIGTSALVWRSLARWPNSRFSKCSIENRGAMRATGNAEFFISSFSVLRFHTAEGFEVDKRCCKSSSLNEKQVESVLCSNGCWIHCFSVSLLDPIF
ncbi:hypothetical protein M514_25863 [Trichuris suis]|uniref:Uncharacterized protein n=1 Tax=Trichuris suis TaxID=68888 RepID=A0A085MXP0_9BILA|nr:hypothetical protein M514_25863 [Trichuris suis]